MQTTGPMFQARLFLLAAVNGLVSYARTLPEGLERDIVRLAIQETASATLRIFPLAVAAAAQAEAMHYIEKIRPEEGERVPISGKELEDYGDQIASYLFAHGEAQPGS